MDQEVFNIIKKFIIILRGKKKSYCEYSYIKQIREIIPYEKIK